MEEDNALTIKEIKEKNNNPDTILKYMNNIEDQYNKNDLVVLKNIADTCEKIIINPEANIKHIKDILFIVNNKKSIAVDEIDKDKNKIILLSLLKVFLETAPLYRINIINDNVTHKKEYLKLQSYDKIYLDVYGKFVNLVVKQYNYTNFKCSTQLIDKLCHFNYIEKIISHVLEGTRSESIAIRNICINMLSQKIIEDKTGDITEKITKQMINMGFGPEALKILFNIPFIKIFNDETRKLYIKNTVVSKNKPNNTNNKKGDKNFMKLTKKQRQEEKKRKIQESKNIKSDNQLNYELMNKKYQHVINSIQRVFLIILKDKMKKYYKYCFHCMILHKSIINVKYLEGINEMLKDILYNDNVISITKFYLIKLLMILGEDRNIDLSIEINCFITLLPDILWLKVDVDVYDIESEIVQFIDFYFLNSNKTHSKSVMDLLIQNLMGLCVLKYMPRISKIVYTLLDFYEIDVSSLSTFGEFENMNKPYFIKSVFDKVNYKK